MGANEHCCDDQSLSLRQIIDSVPALIHTARPDGCLDFFNQTWLDFVGQPLEKLLGWGWTSYIYPEDVEAFVETWRTSIATGERFEETSRVRRADGVYRWMLHLKVPLRNADGIIIKWLGSSVDIEERKRAEEALQTSARLLQRSEFYLTEAQRVTHTGSFIWDASTREAVHLSDEWYRLYELESENGLPSWEQRLQRLHPDDRTKWQAAIKQAIREKSDYELDTRLLLPSGIVRHLHTIGHPVLNTSGDVVQFIGTVTDITERRQAEEALRRSERELREVIETIPAMVWTALPDASNLSMNRRWEEYTGLSATGFSWQAAVHPDDLERHMDAFRRCSAAGLIFEDEVRFRRADGDFRWFSVAAVPMRDEHGRIFKWYGIVTDIEDRKRAEKALRASEREARELLERVPAMIHLRTVEGNSFASERVLKYIGVGREELQGQGWLKYIHPEDRERVLGDVTRSTEEIAPLDQIYRLCGADGAYRWFRTISEPYPSADGSSFCWYGVTTDIDEPFRSRELLREREHELLGIIETIPSMLWSTSPTGEPTHLSKRILEYYGVPFEELAHRGWLSFIHPDDREETAKAFFRAMNTGESYSAINRLRRADGEYRWHHTRGEPLRDPHGKIIQWYGLSIDIDERKRAEDDLRDTRIKLSRASKIATVAELSASIAHELNQPLMAVLANAQAAKRWLATNPPNLTKIDASIERILRDIRSADETMQRIRALFKRESFEKRQAKITDIIGVAVRFVREDPNKHGVLIDCHFDADLPPVSVDPIQIQQVFINLILNAIEAMDGIGIPPVVQVRAAVTDQNEMLVQVIDNGPGVLDPEKIFDAFVTTKESGMGIGLAVSRSIVEAHDGRLWAENNPDGGATFNIALPLASVSRNPVGFESLPA